MRTPLFYTPGDLFGFDIGHSAIKVAQLKKDGSGKVATVGYGYNTFEAQVIEDGIIRDPAPLAESAHALLTQLVVGSITTRHVAVAVPASRCFTRVLTLPHMSGEELKNAVDMETSQYVPIPTDELYIDYSVTRQLDDEEKSTELVMVAAPKVLVDSYLNLLDILGLEPVLLETSLMSNVRTSHNIHSANKPLLLIDFGAKSSDINIFDGSIRVASTIDGGGDSITEAIAKGFGVTNRQAYILKTRHGLRDGPRQKDMLDVIEPQLEDILHEIQKMLRFYKDRESERGDIDTIVVTGGGANLPGLSEYIGQKSKLNVVVDNPWQGIDFQGLQQPHTLESTIYTTSLGLAYTGIGVGK